MHLVITGPKVCNLSIVARQVAKTLKRKHLNLIKEVEHQTKSSLRKLSEMEIKKKEKYIIRKLAHQDNLVIQTLEKTLLSSENFDKLQKNSCIILLTLKPENHLKQIGPIEHSQDINSAFEKRQTRLQEIVKIQIPIDQHLPLDDRKQIKAVSRDIIEAASIYHDEFKKPVDQ